MQYFSTANVPPRERLAILHDFVGRHVARRQFNPTNKDDIRIELAALSLPGQLTLGQARYSPLWGGRTRELIGDGRDDYLLTIHNTDHEVAIGGGRSIKVRAGDMLLVSEGVRSEFQLPDVAVTVVSLERTHLARLAPRLDMHSHYILGAGDGNLSLLGGYVDLLRRTPPDGEAARELASNHVYELAALTLEGFLRGDVGRSERSIGAARLEVAKREINTRLADPALDIGVVAASQGVSTRYIQRLFEAEGVSFTGYVRDRRLDLALDLIRAGALRAESISAIAYRAGFSDLSHFNRSFRARFGITPSEARADALRRRK